MTIIKPGTEVQIGPRDAPITAIVTQVNLVMGGVAVYKVAWWATRTRTEADLFEGEIRIPNIDDEDLMRVGFK